MTQKYAPGLVSIGFPVYNGAAKMRPALESLLNQTYRDIDLIISDNASTDDTETVCLQYAAKDSRIRYFRQPTNLTQVPNIEFVMREARGEYFVLGADDDWWDPRFAEKLKNILDTHLGYGSAIGSVRRIYVDGDVRDEVIYRGEFDVTHKSFAEVFDMMSSERPIHWFCGVFRTKLLQDLLHIPFPKCKAHDRVFMCELALTSHIYSIPEILHHKTVYRQTAADRYKNESIGNQYRDPRAHSKYVWAIVSRLLRSRNIPLLRKFWLYPYHLTAFVWRNRVFLREWFPKSFDFTLRVKGVLKQHNGNV